MTIQEHPSKIKVIHSSVVNCPVCGRKTFSVLQRTNQIPHFGEVLETFASCDFCKYKTNDLLPLSSKKYPVNHKIPVSKKSLMYRVVKGKNCGISIPELGIKISPGPSSEFYISNIEGVLDRISSVLSSIRLQDKKKSDSMKKILSKIKSSKKKGGITLQFHDKNRQTFVLKECKNN